MTRASTLAPAWAADWAPALGPALALALAALPLPAPAQEAADDEAQSAQQAQEGTEPAAAEQDTAEQPAEASAATEGARADADLSQGGTGALVNADGAQLGNVSISLTPSGIALVNVQAEGFPEGAHGIHVHMAGLCEGPTFESAGDHLGTGEHEHGIMAEGGPHPGDLPNGNVSADGVLTYEAFAVADLTMDMVFDEDGSALIVHAEPDDYTTQPGGASGDRIACAVLEPGGELAPQATDDGTDPVDAAQEGAASGG